METEEAEERAETGKRTSPRSRRWASRPRTRRASGGRPEDHPFLELQRAGFDMLERELGGVRRSVSRVSARLCRVEALLRPLARVAHSLGRLADAVERLVPAASSPPAAPLPPDSSPAHPPLLLLHPPGPRPVLVPPAWDAPDLEGQITEVRL